MLLVVLGCMNNDADTTPMVESVPAIEPSDVEPVEVKEAATEVLPDLETMSRWGRALLHRGDDGEFDGFRISAIRRGQVLDRAGFKNGDVVHSVDGHSFNTVTEMMVTYNALEGTKGPFEVKLSRRGEPITLRVDLAHALEALASPPEEVDPSAPLTQEEREERLRALQERLKARRAASGTEPGLAHRLGDLGRAVHHKGPDGEHDGYRLSAIRDGSPLSLLGFKNGDIVRSADGLPVTNQTEVLLALARLRTQTKPIAVQVMRRGTLQILQVDPAPLQAFLPVAN